MDKAVAGTAIGPMVIAAADQHDPHPVVRDDLAARILPTSGRLAAAAARWRPVRSALVAATEKKIPGLWAGMLCRKRYIDDRLAATDAEAVVVLGAGFDTRGCRLRQKRVFEVDLPANIESKRGRLRAIFGEVPPNLSLVPIDFESQRLDEVLAEHGYDAGLRTFFVWEAVTQYLTEEAVRAAFGFLAQAPTGSELVFTFVRRDFLDGTALFGGEAAYREFVVKRRVWKFGLLPEEVAGFVAPYGWAEVEQLGPSEFTERYIASSGRSLPVSEIERTVRCVKVADQ
ncbi:SAM-dependent methyltransferase [Lentzea flaviverrucosa]|uniref:S-adenosyl-L-methionine-dependent methyltransferase n=1 Tax=Lentzea flaviverrucosa TaxID=200379 RepID=A0A1H9XXN9_9PSEU|nr:SAM-dependent methyltransferase [Lentzea flaviverrucosa]RDI34386.1 methyltransferase (TIGR00027 family) [Lentzea flaviverrucosa]SES50443.1 methyltransferase, TIGR00027 family [Lentzea flaviverrucosa]